MAGNYPDAPSWRMAYDRDGSIGVIVASTQVITQMTEAQVAQINDESATAVRICGRNEDGSKLAVIFPELRDVDAVAVAVADGAVMRLEVSEDTTNGADGTWDTLFTFSKWSAGAVVPWFRTGVTSATALGVRAVRVHVVDADQYNDSHCFALHIYGERSPGQSLNALELWHPTNDEKLPPAWLDWGNTPRGSSEDRTFRVKNVSTTSTAEDVRVAMDVLTDGSPSVPGQHLLSYGGGAFLAQVNVGDLAPGAISGPVTVRRVTASDAQLGLFAFRVFAEPDAWS